MRRFAIVSALSAVLGLAQACAMPKSAPPEAPSAAIAPEERAPSGAGDFSAKSPQTQPAPAPPAPMGQAPSEGRGAELRRAAERLESAQRELDVSASDCAAACRALGSMDRAAGHLCDLASEIEERRRCEDAKVRVLGARDRVRSTCGSCPGGPSVERSAPIPSIPFR